MLMYKCFISYTELKLLFKQKVFQRCPRIKLTHVSQECTFVHVCVCACVSRRFSHYKTEMIFFSQVYKCGSWFLMKKVKKGRFLGFIFPNLVRPRDSWVILHLQKYLITTIMCFLFSYWTAYGELAGVEYSRSLASLLSF